MANVISVKEAAMRWELAERTVRGLCIGGKIPGAVKIGRSWLIPAGAEKPVDNRIKTGAYVRAKSRPKHLPLPVGVSDYRLASTEYYYIDKTMMLKDFIDERPMVTLFTRPRRFGKTLNMDMLRTFFEKTNEDTSKYFKDKKIWEQGEYYRSFQGKYPVIFITLKDVKHNSWDNTFANIGSIISSEYCRHSDLSKSPKLDKKQKDFYDKMVSEKFSAVDLERSLLYLSEMLKKHYGEGAVIIIDEYDTPIQSGHTNGFYDDVIAFMRNLLSSCFKDNKSLAFGFLTGILRVAKESIFSGLNNLTINSVLDNKYSEYFGFTANEVKEMAAYSVLRISSTRFANGMTATASARRIFLTRGRLLTISAMTVSREHFGFPREATTSSVRLLKKQTTKSTNASLLLSTAARLQLISTQA